MIINIIIKEIVIPSIQHLAAATENACTYNDIIIQECLILKTLEWEMNITNFSTWINETTITWDTYVNDYLIDSNEFMLNIDLISLIRFRINNNIQSLMLFRMYTQYIDLISLDTDYLFYSEKIICLTLIYLLILKSFNLIDFTKIAYLKIQDIDHLFELNLLFDRFLNKFYSLEFPNIFDHIQYVSCFLDAQLHFDGTGLDNIVKFFILFIVLKNSFFYLYWVYFQKLIFYTYSNIKFYLDSLGRYFTNSNL